MPITSSNPIPTVVWDDQTEFTREDPSPFGGGFVAVTRPISDRIASMVPDAAVLGALRSADRAARFGVDRNFDHDVSDLIACRNAALRIGRAAAVANATTGGVSGLGGAATMLVDLPASMTIAMRAIQRIATAYGFDPDAPTEAAFRLAILELSATSDPDARKGRIHALQAAIGRDGTLTEPSDGEESVLEIGVERVARTIAFALARRQLGSSLPIVGGVVGAAVNASFQTNVASAARFAYQSRRIAAATVAGAA